MSDGGGGSCIVEADGITSSQKDVRPEVSTDVVEQDSAASSIIEGYLTNKVY